MPLSKKIKNFLLLKVLTKVVFFLCYCILSTLRITIINREAEERLLSQDKSILYASWHGEFFLYPYLYRWKSNYNNLVSPSKDGELIAALIQLWGNKFIQGSSFKKPREALYSMKRCIESGEHVFSIADGSRGPYHELQQGIPLLASLTGAPILFISFDYSHKIVFPSWDKFRIPLPFSRAIVTYSDPIHLDRKLPKEEFQKHVERLQEEFRLLSHKTSKLL